MKKYFVDKSKIEALFSALDAEKYRLVIAPEPDKGLPKVKNRELSPEQLLSDKWLKFMKYKNIQGYHIFFRPLGWRYVLLDDLRTPLQCELAARLFPCVAIETSPHNFHYWLRLASEPPSREMANTICKALAQFTGADTRAANPDQVGRLPEFTNQKTKYKVSLGLSPKVELRKYANREANTSLILELTNNFLLPAKDSAYLTPEYKPSAKQSDPLDTDQSRVEFKRCLYMLSQGSTDSEIEQYLLHSLRVTGRQSKKSKDYIKLTLANAKKIVNSKP
jgi:hypothetical protein